MAWSPPASKWKTQRFTPSGSCGNGSAAGIGPGQCVIRQRFDALADPRVITFAGFEQVCADHFDDGDPPLVGVIQLFTGEWMDYREWHAYEAAWYSWVVFHEIGERPDITLAERIESQSKQALRSRRVSAGVPNLDRVSTDDGPWKPLHALRNPSQAARDSAARASGWALRDSRLAGTVRGEILSADPDAGESAMWWEGSLGDRALHVDSLGRISPPQRRAIADVVELRFGPSRLIWDG